MITTLAAWLNDLDPFAIRFSGDIGIRWYGLAYIAGFIVAYLVLSRLAKRGLLRVPSDRIGDAMMWLIGGTLVGGRLVYVLIYDRALLTDFSGNAPFWGVFAINRGGMASHGGIIGVILASWRISRGWKTPTGQIVGRTSMLHVLDATALVCPFGLFFGRLANFVNGELLGKIHSPAGVEGPWWTVQFPKELIHDPVRLTPEQDFALHNLVNQAAPGAGFDRGLGILVENAARHAAELKPLLTSRYPSQLFQAAAEGIVLVALLWLIWARPRKPGVIGSWFMIVYGALRIVTEFWRLPDSQFGPRSNTYGLSMGQWLSVAMVVVGLVSLVIVSRRPVEKLGGWLGGRGSQREPANASSSTMSAGGRP